LLRITDDLIVTTYFIYTIICWSSTWHTSQIGVCCRNQHGPLFCHRL